MDNFNRKYRDEDNKIYKSKYVRIISIMTLMSKTTSPQKLFPPDYITLYVERGEEVAGKKGETYGSGLIGRRKKNRSNKGLTVYRVYSL